MKRTQILVAVFLALVMSPLVRAEAQSLTDQQIISIRTGCTTALRGLKQVQSAEAASRVNRGQSYERMSRLMSALNSRVALNKIDKPALTSTTVRLQTQIDQFQSHYIVYADRLDDALSINCVDAPVSFYDSLTSVREARTLVAEDIVRINLLYDQYQTAVTDLVTTYVAIEQDLLR